MINLNTKKRTWHLIAAYSLFLLAGKTGSASPAGHHSMPPAHDTIVFRSFPQEINLSLQNVFRLNKGGARKLFAGDSNLLVWHSNPVDEHFFSLYSLSGKILNQYFKEGSGYGETTSSLTAGIYKNAIWLQDLNLHKLIMTEYGPSEPQSPREYKIPEFYYNVHLKDSLRLIGNGATHSRYKMQEIDLPTGKIIAEYGTVGDPPAGIPFYSWKSAQESFLFLHPDGQKAVMANRFSDQIDVFDLQTHQDQLTKGPENYEVEFEPLSSGGFDVMARTGKTRFGFLNGSVTGKYIYLLYSGYNHESKHSFYGKYIYVYDWNGKPVKKIILDRHIASLAVAGDDSAIYAFDADSRFILKAKLPVN